MAVNVNVIGRLGSDSEIIDGKNGKFLTFRMATDEFKEGEKSTAWLRVAYYGERAVKLAEYLKKGKLINVFGTETISIYTDKSGNPQASRDVRANAIDFISIGSGQTQANGVETTSSTPEPTTGKLKPTVAASVAASVADDEKSPADDLPF